MSNENSTVPISRVTLLTPFQLLAPPVKIAAPLETLIKVISKVISLVKVVTPAVMLIPAATLLPMIVLKGELPEPSESIVIEVVMVEKGEVVKDGVTPESIRMGLGEVALLTELIAADNEPELLSPAELVTGVEVVAKRS